MSAIKTTIIGGVFILLPFAVLAMVLQELIGLALYIAEPIASLFPMEDIVGVALVNVIAMLLILIGCYIAGLLASTAALSGASGKLNDTLSQLVPGYSFIVAKVESMLGVGGLKTASSRPVIVQVGGVERFGFEINRSADAQTATVFFPGSPNPESGFVGRVQADQTKDLDMTPADVVRMLSFYGKA